MKKRKNNYILSQDEFKSLCENHIQYMILLDYVKQKVLYPDLISTPQIVEKYYVTRQTVYRLVKSGLIKPIIKHRTNYFNTNDVEKFFEQYRKLKE